MHANFKPREKTSVWWALSRTCSAKQKAKAREPEQNVRLHGLCPPLPFQIITAKRVYNQNMFGVRSPLTGESCKNFRGPQQSHLRCPVRPPPGKGFLTQGGSYQNSIPNMTGRRTMEMIGGSSASYLAHTPCVPLFCTLINRGGNRKASRLPGEGGDEFHCTVEPSPVTFGVDKCILKGESIWSFRTVLLLDVQGLCTRLPSLTCGCTFQKFSPKGSFRDGHHADIRGQLGFCRKVLRKASQNQKPVEESSYRTPKALQNFGSQAQLLRPCKAYSHTTSSLVGYTPSTAGNSMTGSERPSPEPLLKKEASPAVLRGREFWKCSGSLKCL